MDEYESQGIGAEELRRVVITSIQNYLQKVEASEAYGDIPEDLDCASESRSISDGRLEILAGNVSEWLRKKVEIRDAFKRVETLAHLYRDKFPDDCAANGSNLFEFIEDPNSLRSISLDKIFQMFSQEYVQSLKRRKDGSG